MQKSLEEFGDTVVPILTYDRLDNFRFIQLVLNRSSQEIEVDANDTADVHPLDIAEAHADELRSLLHAPVYGVMSDVVGKYLLADSLIVTVSP